MRYFIHLGYDGSKYHGWQRQKSSDRTVQEVIEHALCKIFKKDITVFGCGRTDTGVHASQYALHIDLDAAPDFDLKFRLNLNLPDDIAIFEIIEVDEKHHAQYHAVARTYDYFIHWNKDPALVRFSTYYAHKVLDFELMQQATALIGRTKNFTALCKHPDLYENTRCKISNCAMFVNEAQGRLRFTITSNRFLRGMVRYCVFFLIEIGNGDLTLAEFEHILTENKHYIKKRPAPPNGLFLSKVDYPFLEFEDAHSVIRMMKVGLE